MGQAIDLQKLLAGYGIRGSSVYSKGLMTVNAASWLDLYGQFLYSEPETNVNYQQNDTGNQVVENQLLFYTSQAYLLTAAAKMPHTSGQLRSGDPAVPAGAHSGKLADRPAACGGLRQFGQSTDVDARREQRRWRRCWRILARDQLQPERGQPDVRPVGEVEHPRWVIATCGARRRMRCCRRRI